MKILIAEDDFTTCTILAEVLKKQGHEVVVTVNGAEAWAALQQPDAPRLAILDWMMTEMNGIEVCRRVCTLETDDPPYIIILTAKGEKADIIAGLEAGANDYLAKPFDLGEFRARVNVGRRMVELQAAMADKVRQLRESEKRYRSIFENAVEGVFQTVLEGCFVAVNPAMARIHGFTSPEEMITGITDIGKQLYVNPENRVQLKRLLEECGVVVNYEVEHYRKDGSIIWVSVNAHIVKDEAGKIRYYEGTIEDITSRKLAEEELKQTLEKLRKSLVGTIQAMSLTVETRDPYTAGHQRKVSNLARTIAQEMGLSKDTVDAIRMAGIIHDIGKISVPAEILSRPGRLKNMEFSLIKAHSQTGYDILKDVGLPTSHRPYRPGFGIDVALGEIEKNKGILYDAEAVEVCVKLFPIEGT
ncbi:MAG: PAS domain S-box protein [Proteobacteria bacterium]|nr:PAS domain S-box protein [Pseudomonadota bacterium]